MKLISWVSCPRGVAYTLHSHDNVREETIDERQSTELEVNSLTPANSTPSHIHRYQSRCRLCLGVQPVMARTAISTWPTASSPVKSKVAAQGGEMVAYRAAPAGAISPPMILVVQEIFGVHEYIRDICRRLAKLGYLRSRPNCSPRQAIRASTRRSRT